MAAGRARRLACTVAVAGLSLATACSGGGSSKSAGLDEEFKSTPGERNVSFPGAGKLNLAATLALPVGAKGPVPGVLIIPGPGATTRDGPIVARPPDPLYKDLSEALTAAGVATLRYDHRGSGESQLKEGTQLSWEDMVADAREALAFLAQRGEVDPARVAVIGHDTSGPIALKLAATDKRVKSVALVSAPGRPLVEVWADMFKASAGQESADAFRTMIGGLLATGALPPRDSIRPEYQTLLTPNQDAFFKDLFSLNPLADAPAVKVPVVLAVGQRSTGVTSTDATRLSQALGGKSEIVEAPNSSPTLQQMLAAPVRPFDPTDMDSHGLGPPVAAAPREPAAVARLTSSLAGTLGAHAA